MTEWFPGKNTDSLAEDLADAPAFAGLSNGIITAALHGAVGDGTTNDGPEIQAALDEAGANGGGTVMLSRAHGSGVYISNQQLVIPNKVELVSDSRETIIRAGGSFPTSTPLVRLGSGSLVFGCRVRNLTLDCNGVASSTGVYSTDVNEQSGLFNVVVTNFKLHGVHFENNGSGTTNPSIIVLRDLEVMPHSTGATNGVFFDEVAGQNLISGITVGVQGTVTSCIRLLNSQCQVQSFHAETCTNGVDFDSSTGSVIGASGHGTVTNLVRIRSSSRAVVVLEAVASGATNIVLDDFNGVTLPATINGQQALPFYSAAEAYVGGLKFTPVGGDYASWTGTMLARRATWGQLLEGGETADAERRWAIDTDGQVQWGSGAVARDVAMQRTGANLLSMADGDSFRVQGTWNGGTLRLGSHYLWVDATGDLRIKSSAPTSDTDGTVVGTQT